MSTIHPTHRCFDDAIEIMGEHVRRDEHPTLVHAICLGDDGEPYAHAWVESRGEVWEAGVLDDGRRIHYSAVLLDYRAARRVQRTWRYDLREMIRENRRTGTLGPWVPELRALCGPSHRIVGRIDAIPPPPK